MKPFFYTLFFLLITLYSTAQTWTGNTSTDWNTATNWSGNAVPLPAGNVTIPTAPSGNRWPVLAANVSINSLTMATGSQLNVNGRTLTIGTLDLNGTISNSDGATDISITITSSATTFIRNASFTDHVVYMIQGTGVFYDTYGGGTPNTYSGNVDYQRSGIGTTYIGYYARNQYGGNVIINATVPVNLSAFEGGVSIAGNFSCAHLGLGLTLGNVSYATNIAGTVTITASGSGAFSMNRLINQTQGGSITLQDRAGTDIIRDTIKVNAITITGQTGALEFNNNSIAGNLDFTGGAALGATSYVRSNMITGTASFTVNGTGVFYDTYSGGTANTYTGNVSYQRNGAGTTYIGYYARNQYGGNVSITGTVPVNLTAFEAGASIAGNLSCMHIGLGLTLGHVNNATNIAGTLTIQASGSGTIGISRLINQTQGGSITLQDRSSTDVSRDTIKVNTITITGQTGALEFNSNSIVGNLNFTGGPTLTATSYVRSNVITGTASFTLNGTGVFYDTYSSGTANAYSGNVSYQRNGAGTTWIGYYARNQYGANVSITGTLPVNLSAFEAGATIAGNFSCTHIGLGLTLGNVNYATNIAGTVNIVASGSGGIEMFRLINQTPGGTISFQDRGSTAMFRDTLTVNALSITGQTGALDFNNNSIVGNLNFTGATTLGATSYVRSNVITGTVSFTMKSTGVFYDTFGANTGNIYGASVSYTRDSTGPLYVGYYDTVTIGGNLSFNYNTGSAVDNRYFAFNGSSPSVISQDGNGVLQFYGLVMQKSIGLNVTLNDSLRIVENVSFTSGNLVTASQKELIFLSGATTTGASDVSKVVGPVVKIGAQAFTFPMGGAGHLQAVNMTAPVGATSRFRAEYKFANPHPTYDTSMRAAGLAAVSGCEYWHVLREIGTTNVSVTFDYGAPCLCVEVPANLRVAKWNGAQWTNLGNGGTTGDISGGTVKPTAAVSDYGIFTLGSSATVTPSVSIARDVANPICVCRRVTFTATPTLAGCNPLYQWKKNGVNVGTNSNIYSDSALVNGDIIDLVLTSSAAFASPGTAVSNTFNITTTDITTWTGTSSTNWNVANNWSCQSVPCTLSKVTVPGGTPNVCEILSDQVKVVSLTANTGGTIRVLNGSTLELKQP